VSRVAIIGSCITRDLWPVGAAAPGSLLYISRTSLPSLFSHSITGIETKLDPPDGLARHQHNAVVADLRKLALEALVAHRPTHIIFDFIDERFDLLAVGGALATHSWELEVSGYLAQPALQGRRPIARTSAAYDRLWIDALDQLCAVLQATRLGEARLILHQAQWAQRRRDADGQIHDLDARVQVFAGRDADIAEHNALLRRCQDRFAATTGAVQIEADAGLRLADSAHRWGLSPFHYVADYYSDIRRQLAQAGVAW